MDHQKEINSANSANSANSGNNGTVWEHITEMRRYIIVSAVSVIAFSILAHFFYKDIVRLIFAPLGGEKTIFLSPLDPIVFILKIDFSVGFILSLPIIFWSLIKFVSPAVGKTVLKRVIVAVMACSALVVVGVVYAYYLIVPVVFRFVTGLNVPGTEFQITAQNYLNFVLSQLLIAILLFQTPLIIIALTYIKILNPYLISRKRPLVYLLITIVASVATPTSDLVSLSLVLIPTIVVLELGVVVSKVLYNRMNKNRGEEHFDSNKINLGK